MATAAQIQSELEAWNLTKGDYYNTPDGVHDALWSYREGQEKSFEIPSGTVTLVENFGGGSGDGEERYIVIKVGDQLFQWNGYYSSWDGSEWADELREVEPYSVQVTKYREIG
jgi:hypothetical protein